MPLTSAWASVRRQLRDPRVCFAIAVGGWIVTFALVALRVGHGHQITDCWHVYSIAGRHWSARAPLYDLRSIDDFQYFPHAAIFFSLLAPLGSPWSGIVWRLFGWTLLALGLWRVCAIESAGRQRLFLIASALVIPPALTSVLNGQANLPTAAFMLHAAVDLQQQRRRAALWLAVGLALKPLMAVLMLLAWMVRPRLIVPTSLALAALALLPFVLAPPAYVAAQYHDCWRKLMLSAAPDRQFEDLRSLLGKLGWVMPYTLQRALALIAALGAAWTCWHARRTFSPVAVGLITFAVAGAYLMLFNTRTQPNSYVIIAPAAALPAALFIMRGQTRAAIPLVVIVLCWCGSAIAPTENWLKPLACIVFSALMLREVMRPSTTLLDAEESQPR